MASDLWSVECFSNYESEIISPHAKNGVIVSFIICFFAWLFLVVLRVWLSRYDYEVKLATKYSFWQKDLGYTSSDNSTLISPNSTGSISGGGGGRKKKTSTFETETETKDSKEDSEKENGNRDYYQGQWWIDNKRKYGEEAPMVKILSVFYVIVVVLAISLSPVALEDVDEDAWLIFVTFTGSYALITCGFIAFNVWKVRSIHDNFHIRTEILLFAKVACGVAAVMLLMFFIGRTTGALYDYATMISGLLCAFLLFSISFISTKWVVSEHLRGIEREKEYLLQNLNEDIEGNTNLKPVLSTRDGFEIFMDFLVSEYSTGINKIKHNEINTTK